MAEEVKVEEAKADDPLTIPEGFEWYDLQIAGHHQSVVKNGVRQIGIGGNARFKKR